MLRDDRDSHLGLLRKALVRIHCQWGMNAQIVVSAVAVTTIDDVLSSVADGLEAGQPIGLAPHRAWACPSKTHKANVHLLKSSNVPVLSNLTRRYIIA